MSKVAFLLGRRPSDESLLPDVLDRLEAGGHRTEVHLVAEVDDVEALAGCDLVVLRALQLPDLDRLGPLERAKTRCCNSVKGCRAARDKALAASLLEDAEVPTPRTTVAHGWDAVEELAAEIPIVVKPVLGSRGAGVVFVERGQRNEPPWPGPYLVQERVDGDGLDRKVYVVGGRVAGVLRRWPPASFEEKVGSSFVPGPEERRAALAAGAALGLDVFGVDLVPGPKGPTVVDVNAFPGFKGVPTAPMWLADHFAKLAAAAPEVSPCES